MQNTKERKTKLVVLGIITNRAGEILLTQRHDPDIPDAHLRWDVPGGTNEFGETMEETLRREVLEETGMDIHIGRLMAKAVSRTWEHKDFLQHTQVFCYRCSLRKENGKVNDPKIAQMKWEKISNLKKYDFLATTRQFIDIISS